MQGNCPYPGAGRACYDVERFRFGPEAAALVVDLRQITHLRSWYRPVYPGKPNALIIEQWKVTKRVVQSAANRTERQEGKENKNGEHR